MFSEYESSTGNSELMAGVQLERPAAPGPVQFDIQSPAISTEYREDYTETSYTQCERPPASFDHSVLSYAEPYGHVPNTTWNVQPTTLSSSMHGQTSHVFQFNSDVHGYIPVNIPYYSFEDLVSWNLNAQPTGQVYYTSPATQYYS